MMMTSSAMPEAVLAFLHDTKFDDIPEHVLAFGRRCLLDLTGVAIAGRLTALSGIIHGHAAAHFGAGEKAAPMLFDGRRVSPPGAALAAGMTIDSFDAHDGHKLTKGHTGCHQLAALLALTAAEGKDDPREFLAALVVGYECATRAGIALHATTCDYHTSGAWGALGCAALGSRVLGLDSATTFEAMGIAEYHGPRSQMMRVIDHPTMLKDGSGWGAMTGVSAAYLAADGFTGAPAVTVNDPSVAHLWADIGRHWIIEEQYFKPHPVCRWAQPAVEAALTLCRSHAIAGEHVHRIEVTTFHEAACLATALPKNTEQAQYSLPYPLAAAVMRGRLGAAELMAGALDDPSIRALSQAVEITESETFNAAFPGNRYARVTLHLKDGRSYVSADTEPRGDPESPLSDTEIRAKFHELSGPVIGLERARAIESAIDRLAELDSLQPLLDLLFAPL